MFFFFDYLLEGLPIKLVMDYSFQLRILSVQIAFVHTFLQRTPKSPVSTIRDEQHLQVHEPTVISYRLYTGRA